LKYAEKLFQVWSPFTGKYICDIDHVIFLLPLKLRMFLGYSEIILDHKETLTQWNMLN